MAGERSGIQPSEEAGSLSARCRLAVADEEKKVGRGRTERMRSMTGPTWSSDMPTFWFEQLEMEMPIVQGQQRILGRGPYQGIEGRAGLSCKHD